MNKQLLREIAIKHQNEILQPFDVIMDAAGFDALNLFVEHFGGMTTYIPQEKTIFMRCLERAAAAEFNGRNYAELGRKYGLSQRHMYRLFSGV